MFSFNGKRTQKTYKQKQKPITGQNVFEKRE